MIEVLELMEKAKSFTVKKDEDGYTIDSKFKEISAEISNSLEITYYVTGAYNSGIDWLEIDLVAFDELKKFCELIVSQEVEK